MLMQYYACNCMLQFLYKPEWVSQVEAIWKNWPIRQQVRMYYISGTVDRNAVT